MSRYSTGEPTVTVIGIGADGWPGVPEATRERILAAGVLLGGARHLDLVPPVEGQVRETWPSPLRDSLPSLLSRYAGQRIVALASGDPLVSGIGGTLIDLVGPSQTVEIVPAVSSVALARARMGWSSEGVAVVSLVGRDPHLVLRELAPDRRVLVLSSDGSTPARVAQLLSDAGYGGSRMTVLADLGSAAEAGRAGTAADWTGESPALNVIALSLDGPIVGSLTGGLPDDAFDHDGQISKRDIRAAALSRLAPQPGQLLWDVGAGAGSVGIEWLRAHPTCRAIAIEGHPERATRIAGNAQKLGVPGLTVVLGRAPEALTGLEAPDAVFIGGGATVPGVIDSSVAAVREDGRIVVHGVTVETEAVLAAAHARHGGELTRFHIEHSAAIGAFTGWTPARAVTQWSWVK